MTINDVKTSRGALQSSSISIYWHTDLLNRYWNVKCFLNIGYFSVNNYLSCINVKVSLVKCKKQSDRNLMEKMLVDIILKINDTIWQCRLLRAVLNGSKICDGKGVSQEPSDADALVKRFIIVTSLATDRFYAQDKSIWDGGQNKLNLLKFCLWGEQCVSLRQWLIKELTNEKRNCYSSKIVLLLDDDAPFLGIISRS